MESRIYYIVYTYYIVNIVYTSIELLSSSQISHPLWYAKDDLDYLYNQNRERIERGMWVGEKVRWRDVENNIWS